MTSPTTSDRRGCPPRPYLAVELLEDRNAPGELLGGPDADLWPGQPPTAPDSRPPAVTGTRREPGHPGPILTDTAAPVPDHRAADAALPRSGDAAPASAGRLEPAAVLLSVQAASDTESGGQLYITTVGDNAIKRANPAGQVRDFATSGLSAPVLLDFDHAGNIYVANFFGNSISKVTPNGDVSTFASVNAPIGVQFDAHGTLYVSSPFISTISKVAPNGTVTPFVSAGLNQPLAMVFDHAGNMFVTNFGPGPPNQATPGAGFVTKITPDGTVSTIVSGLTGPTGLIFDAAGTLYVASDKSRIDKIAPNGTVTPFVTAGLSTPADMTFGHDGVLYVANENGGSVSKVTPDGTVSTFITGLLIPQDVAFRPGSEG
jgi:sugar lactone lactonase YvrE